METARLTIPIFTLFFVFLATAVYADIYKYVTEDGIESFTDSPSQRNAVLMIKEPNHTSKSARKQANVKRGTIGAKPATASVALATVISEKLPVQGVITSGVGLRSDPFDGILRYHKGVDIAIPTGTPVRPVAPGTVLYSGHRSGYGNVIILQHLDGMMTIYGHNSTNLVVTGDRVDADKIVAFSGSTGRSTGPHLHFEAWKDGVNVTSGFMASGKNNTAEADLKFSHQNKVRTAFLPDGSVLFTNMP